uniref:Glycosyltransferase n=1 Tax=Dictyoglomus turgidum TaxID=513050 RepID=A0A7C3SNH6_9BACT
MEEKIKVLALCDSPTVSTGFATVSKNVLKVLADTGKYSIDIVGINFDGSYYDREKFPYQIYPAVNALIPNSAYYDLFGRQLFLDKLGSGKYDLVWILQDTFIIEPLGPRIVETNEKLPPERKFKWIYYFPIDARPKKEWIDNSVLLADYPVAYTKYGYNEVLNIYSAGFDEKSNLTEEQKREYQKKYELLKSKLDIIYHGINPKEFYPIKMTEEERMQLRKKFFGEEHYKKFIFMNMNRNQPRKDLFRSMLAAKLLLDKRRAKGKNDVYFYFHCLYQDITGLDLIEMAEQINFIQGKEWAFPNPLRFTTAYGFPTEIVNQLYNAVDCIISTSLGEGFGLSVLEGMATKKPVIMPNNTSMPEIIGNNERGLLVKSGATIQDWFVQANDNNRARPLTDVNDLVDKMEWVMEHPEEVKTMVENAYQWVSKLNWDGELIGEKWKSLFEKAYKELLEEREVAKIDWRKLGRNDICPICKIKVKKCKHSNLIK